MLFNSLVFIFLFLPVVVAGYWALAATGRHRPRLIWLAAASLFFYGYWAPRYILLLVFSMTVNYLLAAAIQRLPEGAGRRRNLLIGGIVFNLALLFYFKYFNFFIDNLNAVTGAGITIARIVLPLAISFFTFQKIALLFDVYRKKVRLGPVTEYVTFVLFFPQLIAGPIVHYSELAPQLADRPRLSAASRNILIGLIIFAIGLFKKTVLADTAALYASPIFDAARDGSAPGFVAAWTAAFSYTLQIYFDFSGYSDMAIGLARMFGVLLPLNFHSPLRSGNMAELWRRWHMTLSRFVQSYIFQPLSMPLARYASQRFTAPYAFLAVSTLAPTFLSMVIIGVWHGAGWNFVIFGAMHGIYVATYNAWDFYWKKKRKKNPQRPWSKAAAHIVTILCFVAATVPFRAVDVHVTGRFFGAMLGLNDGSIPWSALVPLGAAGAVASLTIGWLIVALLPNTQHFMTRIEPALEWAKWRKVAPAVIPAEWKPTIGWAIVSGVFLFVGVAFIMRGTTEFIYFNF
ncbi:MBOAT family protein [Microvirga sp. SRT01]|uniref:Probable alginate O-acetylase AlgI n=1 Tax=Sphingomonas longa TaxID=2778730 RepID=A0ABS2D3E5_9SPHN|nr:MULTISPECIES: MBOAT family O-acyltransferase [Alphaproteobacteria]MBM6575434.1 MBOAT family protein [Sphingomonas sp. BT552]MBR7708482.1 MBOAT family protein [Microvirga sp. SRT01]